MLAHHDNFAGKKEVTYQYYISAGSLKKIIKTGDQFTCIAIHLKLDSNSINIRQHYLGILMIPTGSRKLMYGD